VDRGEARGEGAPRGEDGSGPLTAPSLLASRSAGPACCDDEEWVRLPGWPHEASTCGRVRSVNRLDESGVWRLGAILPQFPDKRPGKGYLYVNLRDGKRFRRAAVAVVVLEAHRGARPFPDWEACHNDGVRTDNHVTRLRWDSRPGNLADQQRHALERKAREGVTENYAKADETGSPTSRQARFPRKRLPWPGRYSHAANGTGSFCLFPISLSHFIPLTSSLRSLRSLRSSRRTR
jgi:hypothetical protein